MAKSKKSRERTLNKIAKKNNYKSLKKINSHSPEEIAKFNEALVTYLYNNIIDKDT